MEPEFWAQIAALEGEVLKTATGWLHVLAVDAWGLRVVRGRDALGPETRLSRRGLEAAARAVAAGLPLPPPLRPHAAGVAALLRAAGIGSAAQGSAVSYLVHDQPEVPGPPAGSYRHRDLAAAEEQARLLLARYEAEMWHVVERVTDHRRRRWVLRRGGEWAAVEVRADGAPGA